MNVRPQHILFVLLLIPMLLVLGVERPRTVGGSKQRRHEARHLTGLWSVADRN